MNKTIFTACILSLVQAMIIQSSEKEPLASELKPSRSCSNFCFPIEYTSVKPSNRVNSVGNKIISFAAKSPEWRLGLQEGLLSDNERLSCVFCAPKKNIAAHLNKRLSNEIEQLRDEDRSDLPKKLSAMLGKLMDEFYDDHPNESPCNTANQKLAILFLHLKDLKFCPYQLYCDDEGEFKLTRNEPYTIISEDQNVHFFIPLQTESSSWPLDSPTYKLILKNRLSRNAMLKKQECMKQILKGSHDGTVLGYIHLKSEAWKDLLTLSCKTDTYRSLQKKWPASAPIATDTLEEEILMHRSDSTADLAVFAKKLRKSHELGTSPEEQASFAFLDDMIEQKQTEEASSRLACIISVAISMFKSCGSR